MLKQGTKFSLPVLQDAMEKAVKHKVAKAVVPAIDAMFQALRYTQCCSLITSAHPKYA